MGIRNWIDSILNRITMYRLVLYYLIGLLIIGVVFSSVGLLPYDPVAVLLSALFLVFFCEGINDIFSRVFSAPVNVESTTITALILACVMSPVRQIADFVPLAMVALVAVSSKYILAIRNKHIFNPVAIAIFVSAVFFHNPPTWWMGTRYMALYVLFGGLLVVRKIRRESMVWAFFGTVFLVASVFTFLKGASGLLLYQRLILHSSMMFLAFAMLTEPMTSPPTVDLQIIFGVIVGFLFVPDVHVGRYYSTPELALLIGNVYAYAVSPKEKLVLYLKKKIQVARDTVDFIFTPPQGFRHVPGQYMEWTLPHARPDDRGNRRYFTLASSPTEEEVRIGVKFYTPSSTYKQALSDLDFSTPIVAAQRAGDFVLPKNPKQKIVCIAGGIGITPFRSMFRYLLDSGGQRDVVLLYANKTADDIAYREVLDDAQSAGVRTIYTLTHKDAIPQGWTGHTGRIDAAMIMSEIPDYRERLFYLSGPNAMVKAFEQVLHGLGIRDSRIKKDFFPGFV